MRKIVLFLPLLALVIAPGAHADATQSCDNGTIAAVAHWAGVKGKLVSWDEDGGLIAAAACKAMPNAPGTVIAAAAFDTKHEGPAGEDGSKLQVIALVEEGKVVAADRSTIEEDALTEVGSYRIDTAPYRLSPDVRAFGVVFTSRMDGSSCADASAWNELTLWVRERDHLHAVMGTNLNGWVNTEGAACSPGIGDARSESAHMTVAVEKTSSNGFADISLTAHITQSQRKNDENLDTGKRVARIVLKYDGQTYGIDMFRNFWYPDSAR